MNNYFWATDTHYGATPSLQSVGRVYISIIVTYKYIPLQNTNYNKQKHF